MQVLEHSKSSYLTPFLNLRSLIQHEAVAAEDNVTFLLVLEAPCKVLAAASPEEIPTALPRILHFVRLIWNLSRFYSVPDRITGLMRKVRSLEQGRPNSTVVIGELYAILCAQPCFSADIYSFCSPEEPHRVIL